MTAPTITHLPIAPARLSRPSNFVTESTVFLAALSSFRIELNWLSSYLNSTIQNKYNFGKLEGIRSFPTIYQISDYNIEYTGDGIDFTSDLDVFYNVLNQYSGVINPVGVWFDSVIEEVGIAPYDLDKPLVNGVTAPMDRSQSRDDFNSSALSFNQTATDYINSLYQSIYYTYITSCADKNFGSITDTTIIKTINCGSITDTTLTY
jgi:hypothetical protein